MCIFVPVTQLRWLWICFHSALGMGAARPPDPSWLRLC